MQRWIATIALMAAASVVEPGRAHAWVSAHATSARYSLDQASPLAGIVAMAIDMEVQSGALDRLDFGDHPGIGSIHKAWLTSVTGQKFAVEPLADGDSLRLRVLGPKPRRGLYEAGFIGTIDAGHPVGLPAWQSGLDRVTLRLLLPAKVHPEPTLQTHRTIGTRWLWSTDLDHLPRLSPQVFSLRGAQAAPGPARTSPSVGEIVPAWTAMALIAGLVAQAFCAQFAGRRRLPAHGASWRAARGSAQGVLWLTAGWLLQRGRPEALVLVASALIWGLLCNAARTDQTSPSPWWGSVAVRVGSLAIGNAILAAALAPSTALGVGLTAAAVLHAVAFGLFGNYSAGTSSRPAGQATSTPVGP